MPLRKEKGGEFPLRFQVKVFMKSVLVSIKDLERIIPSMIQGITFLDTNHA